MDVTSFHNKRHYSISSQTYPIADKDALLNAMRAQMGLEAVSDNTWESLGSGLAEMVRNLGPDESISVLFEDGIALRVRLKMEFAKLDEIIEKLNSAYGFGKIGVIFPIMKQGRSWEGPQHHRT